MKYRIASILAPEAANTAGTKTLDINLADPISRIIIQFKGTNNGSVITAHPAKMISKIELVDGSDVLFSLSGTECQALNYYDKGKMPLEVVNYCNDIMAIATFELDFGRYLWDPVYAFDPKKFINPQLKITHNKALGGSAPDAGELAVFAQIFDEKKITPVGFLMNKEQYGYTLVAGATEHIDLATDYPYRKLLLQAMSTSLQPWEQYNQIKLDQDNGRKMIINDEKVSNLLKMIGEYPQFQEIIEAPTKNGTQTIPCAAGYERIAALTGMAADADAYLTQTYGGSIKVADSAAAVIDMIVSGFCPHNTFCLPFGSQEDPEDWFDVEGIGSLKLSLKGGGSASGTVEVISQQVRTY
jgi:hypothetical protein